ncbi:MAG: SpoIIE family protein phosphatase [Anaerolineae bacterium]|nr:SpoIIE family protein phosphatase [Anaerolineales bacterium]MCB8934737.1 SpoIIE family protein phosphatase [Promineifilum sp.]MCW5847202.1 SpoIIE family protein phosphatase [Anaerolineae bacterium]
MTVPYVHVLVIDDDEKRGRHLTEPFALWGWDTTHVGGDVEAALARLRQGPYDLVLLDLRAAESDHYAFLRRRPHDPAAAAIPVVITAHAGASLARLERCIEWGAADYIIHPDHHILFRARLQNVLQRKLMQEQANTALEAFNEIEKIADDLRLVILPIGAALSAESEYDPLVARIVAEAQRICNADAGALCLAQDDGLLHFDYLRIESLDFTYRHAPDTPELIPPIPLSDPATGLPNNSSLPVFVALSGEPVNLTEATNGQFDLLLREQRFGGRPFHPRTRLAVPLRSGQIVGTLLLADSRHPLTGEIVEFDAYHQQVAESLASQAAVVLNNRLLNERQAQLLRFKRELEIGREIQLSFLPARLPDPPGWELVAHFNPALEVAGDFYDAFRLPHGYLVLVIADVVGKGVTAALFMAIIRSLFRALFQMNYYETEPRPPAPGAGRTTPFPFVDRQALVNAVRLTNAYLIANHGDTYAFATLFAGVLDPESGNLFYVNAGHNPPLVFAAGDAGGRALRGELSPTGPAIGLLANATYQLGETTLLPGDLLFAFTDGVIESRRPSGEEFSQERLEALLAATGGPALAALAAVEAAVHAHMAGAEAFDDVTMLALRRIPDKV